MWQYTGAERPGFAETPGPGQESVWDYPRPPAIVADARTVEVTHQDRRLARSSRAVRVLETAGPPTFYLPATDVDLVHLAAAPDSSWCEWKGVAQYWRLAIAGAPAIAVAWCYPRPNAAFSRIAGYLAFYPGRVECRVDGERVQPQPGGFYGGWITKEIVGPVKGEPGTDAW